jgi:hypothetical protein
MYSNTVKTNQMSSVKGDSKHFKNLAKKGPFTNYVRMILAIFDLPLVNNKNMQCNINYMAYKPRGSMSYLNGLPSNPSLSSRIDPIRLQDPF